MIVARRKPSWNIRKQSSEWRAQCLFKRRENLGKIAIGRANPAIAFSDMDRADWLLTWPGEAYHTFPPHAEAARKFPRP
jgi:hypothetical protein